MRYLVFLFCAAALCSAQQGYSVETLAGNGVAGFSGDSGAASRAQLNSPGSVVLDSAGRLFIADVENRRVRRVDTNGRISTVATSDDPFTDIAVDLRGTLYIASGSNLRAISAAGSDGPVAGPQQGSWNRITAIAGEPTGTVLVADGQQVYRVATNGITLFATLPAPVTSLYAGLVSTVAIAGNSAYTISNSGAASPLSGPAVITAKTRIAADRWGDVYLSGDRVSKVIQGKEYILIGFGEPGFTGDGGPAVSGAVNGPTGLAVDRGGNVYFSDTNNQRVRLLRATFAGSIDALLPPDAAPQVWPKGVTLAWTTFVQATTYEVFFGTSPETLTRVGSTTTGQFQLTNDLTDRTRYYWQIRTQYAPQPPTESPLFSFTTTTSAAVAPPRPDNPTPGDSAFAQSISPLLSWTGGGAIQYALYFGTDPNKLEPVGVVTDTRLNLSNLAPETTYYWQVIAINEVGGTPSKPWSFTTGPVNGYPFVLDTIAGSPLPVDDGLNGTETVLNQPKYPAVDTAGNVYFTTGDRLIRRLGLDGKLSTIYTLPSGSLSALASDPTNGQIIYATPDYIYRIDPRNRVRTYIAGQIGRRGYGGDGSTADQAVFDGITSLVADRRGNIYIADTGNNRVRVITNGRIRTIAGNGTCGETTGTGPATSLPLCAPSAVAIDASNNLYVYSAFRVLKIDASGDAQVVTGNGTQGYSGDNAPAAQAVIGPIVGIAVDRFGYIYLADSAANTVRIVDPSGTMTTWAGAATPGGSFSGDQQPAGEARFAGLSGITLDTSEFLVVADTDNLRIRRADNVDVFRTVAGMDAVRGDRGNSVAAWLNGPTALAVDGGGNVFIADSLNNRIRRVTPTLSIDTLAGGGQTPVTAATQGRDARELRLNLASGAAVAIDDRGNLLFNSAVPAPLVPTADSPSQVLLTMLPSSILNAVAFSRIGQVGGIVRGRFGEFYVSDSKNHRLWRLDPDGSSSIIAGTGSAGSAGDGGQALTAQLNTPRNLAIDPDGNLYIAELGRIRRMTPAGRISTAAFENASGLAFDKDGVFYVAAGRSVYIATPDRRDRTTLTLVRIAGTEGGTPVTNDIPAIDARVTDLRGLAVGPLQELYISDFGQNAVRRLIRNVPLAVTLVGGDKQTVNDRNFTPQPVQVKVTGRNGVPVAGITVRFVNVTDPQQPRLLQSILTDRLGVAGNNVSLPTGTVGEVKIEAQVFGVAIPAAFTVIGRSDSGVTP